MANHSVARAKHATLGADTVDAITLTKDWPLAEVLNRGEVAIYFRVDGSHPTVGGDDCLVVQPGESLTVTLSTRPNVRDVVELIADDSCAYSVTGASR